MVSDVALPGTSYNPDSRQHQDAIAVAVAAEVRQALDKELQPVAPKQHLPAEPMQDELEELQVVLAAVAFCKAGPLQYAWPCCTRLSFASCRWTMMTRSKSQHQTCQDSGTRALHGKRHVQTTIVSKESAASSKLPNAERLSRSSGATWIS